MTWVRLVAEVADTEAEPLSEALMACGALSSAIEPNPSLEREERFGEPGMLPPALWVHCLVDALLPGDADAHALMKEACAMAGLKECPAYQTDLLTDQDWVRLTQSQFDPIPVTPGLWIVPTWHTPPEPDALNVRLDPGQAFGTGSHPTTRLCLTWLMEHPPVNLRVLDYGCGSGILAIVAHRLGATDTIGVDLDPVAVETARQNAALNHAALSVFLPEALPLSSDSFDVVVANILAVPLMLLAPLLIRHTKPGGQIVLSGILERQTEEVMKVYAPEVLLQVVGLSDGWVCLSGQRR